MRKGTRNGNWKGGLCSFRTADELLNFPQAMIVVRNRLDVKSVRSPSGCLIWVGPIFPNGRAKLTLGKNHLAYRLAYVLERGPIGDLLVMHHCDNPRCIEPDHLFIGTNADNSADMTSKNRQASREKNGGAKLTEQQVSEIRNAVPNGKLYGKRRRLASKYGVNPATISDVVSRKTWRS